ncbi:MAG: hypothetical protein OMM_15011 [Candidatus Magnetoglobus multicellularis str. Araruama]|uniref:Inositol-phosphate phosphatase n=1 Tax=Candidatus Magnetoglobus multicellularis str. Araruama TaxID=890399 RepID=A0A1V1NQX7_9BACT|nr:MAG: hypothetical protein OMM_15011 [Candidatus Magnetoglobus multicellularis str. Araruama]
MLNIVRQVSRVRGFGDTYAYHLLTTGRCEAVIEENISIWDIAAISVIIEEAGGRITEFNGNKINYQTKSVIASNKILHESYINLFNHNNLKSC